MGRRKPSWFRLVRRIGSLRPRHAAIVPRSTSSFLLSDLAKRTTAVGDKMLKAHGATIDDREIVVRVEEPAPLAPPEKPNYRG